MAGRFRHEPAHDGNELVRGGNEAVHAGYFADVMRKNGTFDDGRSRMPIKSKKQFAALHNMSVRHLERLMASGQGPPIVRLGVRKKGIDDEDGEAWIRSRKVVPPGYADVSAK